MVQYNSCCASAEQSHWGGEKLWRILEILRHFVEAANSSCKNFCSPRLTGNLIWRLAHSELKLEWQKCKLAGCSCVCVFVVVSSWSGQNSGELMAGSPLASPPSCARRPRSAANFCRFRSLRLFLVLLSTVRQSQSRANEEASGRAQTNRPSQARRMSE